MRRYDFRGVGFSFMEDIWKTVPGFDGKYEASVTGLIRSVGYTYQRITLGRIQTLWRRPRILKPINHAKGYLTITLMRSKGDYVRMYIHRLIATMFVDNPENLPQVNHMDCNKENNHASNLEWVSNLQNRRHAVEHGLQAHKLSAEDVIAIRLRNGQSTQKSIAIEFGVHPSTIKHI